MNLQQLNMKVKKLKVRSDELIKAAEKAEKLSDLAYEALLNAEWQRDDLIVKSWGNKPDISFMLNRESRGRFTHELKELIDKKSGGNLAITGGWCHNKQFCIQVHMNASEPSAPYLSEACIKMLLPHVGLDHPQSKGFAAFTLCHTQSEHCAYEIWVCPHSGESVLARYEYGELSGETNFDSLIDLLLFAHAELSHSY